MVRLAVVGYGYWGPNIIRNFMESEEAKIVRCCDINKNRLVSLKKKYPTIATTDNYSEVLDDPNIDAIAIVTPVATHYEFARKALERGKHVLVEKPLAASVAEAESLVDIAEKRKMVLMVRPYVHLHRCRTKNEGDRRHG